METNKGILRHGILEVARGNGGDDLLPDQGSHSQEDAPDPLLHVQRSRLEHIATELNDENLEKVRFCSVSCQMDL